MTTSSVSDVSPKSDVLNLEWVEFSEEDSEVCAAPNCDSEAVWVSYWTFSCECWASDVVHYCDAHGQYFINIGVVGADGKRCLNCFAPIKLNRIERYRKGGH